MDPNFTFLWDQCLFHITPIDSHLTTPKLIKPRQRFTNGTVKTIAKQGLRGPGDIKFDSEKNLIFTDSLNHQIKRFHPNGTLSGSNPSMATYPLHDSEILEPLQLTLMTISSSPTYPTIRSERFGGILCRWWVRVSGWYRHKRTISSAVFCLH
jgi:hypothetical protein